MIRFDQHHSPDHFVLINSLDVSRNQLTGTIPTELGLLKKLKNIDVSSNKLEGTLPNEMLDMEPNLRLNFTDNL